MIEEKAFTKASKSSSRVRGLRERKMPFTFDQQFSIGLKSGEYGGRKSATVTWLQIVSRAMQAQHLFHEGDANAKQAGNFRNGVFALLGGRHHAYSQLFRISYHSENSTSQVARTRKSL